MRYFLIEQDEAYVDAPIIINWFEKLDVRKIKKGLSYEIPYRMSLDVRPDKEIYFTDIVSKPFFLYTEIVKQAVSIYEPQMPHKQIMLADKKNFLSELYFMPILEIVDCLSDETILDTDGSIIGIVELNHTKIPDLSIFKLAGISGRSIIVRLDLIESILRRGAKGICLKEATIN